MLLPQCSGGVNSCVGNDILCSFQGAERIATREKAAALPLQRKKPEEQGARNDSDACVAGYFKVNSMARCCLRYLAQVNSRCWEEHRSLGRLQDCPPRASLPVFPQETGGEPASVQWRSRFRSHPQRRY